MFITEGNLSSGASETYQIFSRECGCGLHRSFLNQAGKASTFPLSSAANGTRCNSSPAHLECLPRRQLSDPAAAGAVFCGTVDQPGVVQPVVASIRCLRRRAMCKTVRVMNCHGLCGEEAGWNVAVMAVNRDSRMRTGCGFRRWAR